jgi:myo-inositol-1(or 4)-monophosphatase
VAACPLPHIGRTDPLINRELEAMQTQVAGLRRFGATALDLAFVAAGRFDLCWDRGVKPWDLAAGIVLVREAGGFVSDIDGGDAMLAKGHVVAGNEAMHRETLKVLEQAGKA